MCGLECHVARGAMLPLLPNDDLAYLKFKAVPPYNAPAAQSGVISCESIILTSHSNFAAQNISLASSSDYH